MAASASSVQSIYTTRVTASVGNHSSRNHALVPSLSFPLHQQRSTTRVIRCSVEGQQPSSELPKTTVTSSTSTPPPPAAQYTPPPPPPPPRAPKVSTKFSDVLAFSGPAPERINGRLAMVGFVAALGAELAQGDDVVAQLAHGGLPWFVGTSLVLSLASLIPLFKGVTVESKSDGVMTSSAELLNGRVAMLGLVALIFTEFVKGGALLYTHVQG